MRTRTLFPHFSNGPFHLNGVQFAWDTFIGCGYEASTKLIKAAKRLNLTVWKLFVRGKELQNIANVPHFMH